MYWSIKADSFSLCLTLHSVKLGGWVMQGMSGFHPHFQKPWQSTEENAVGPQVEQLN